MVYVAVATALFEYPAATAMAFLKRSGACMSEKGDRLGDLLAWAKYRWMIDSRVYPNDIAAASLIADACKAGSE